jgi:mRNA interferase RelE/StbE
MAVYKIYFKSTVEKDLSLIPKEDVKKIIKRIDQLAAEPCPAGRAKVTDQERYQLRQGRYRIIYLIQDKELIVWVVKIGHRRDVYS